MDAKELRVGNLIFQIQGEYNDVTDDFDFNDVNKIDLEVSIDVLILIKKQQNYYKHEPIPLTEEWLLKFGFVKNRFDLYQIEYYDKNYDINYTSEYGFHPFTKRLCSYESSLSGVGCEFVHQIQNLHYANTGEELTLKK